MHTLNQQSSQSFHLIKNTLARSFFILLILTKKQVLSCFFYLLNIWNMKNLKKILATIAYNEKWTIRACVADEALARKPDYIEHFFKDLSRYGCICGMVSSLVRYTDTHHFFDKHYDEIMEVIDDYEDEWFKLEFKGKDLKNELAWLSFEKVAMDMVYNDLGLEY